MNISTRKQYFVWRKIASGISVVIVVILLLNFFQSPVRNSFYMFSYPVTTTLWKGGSLFSGFLESLFSFTGVMDENNLLKERNAELLSQMALLHETIAHNDALKSADIIAKENNFTLVSVQTIGLDSNQDTIIINRGADDGLKENMPIISSQKILYGKITRVHKDFSEAMLISSPKSTIDVKIQQADPLLPPVYGAIKGKGYFSIYLDLVPSNAELHTGETLVTSALEGIFPKDLLVGTIVKDTKDDLKPFQTAEIQPFFDAKKIENLFVVTDYPKGT